MVNLELCGSQSRKHVRNWLVPPQKQENLNSVLSLVRSTFLGKLQITEVVCEHLWTWDQCHEWCPKFGDNYVKRRFRLLSGTQTWTCNEMDNPLAPQFLDDVPEIQSLRGDFPWPGSIMFHSTFKNARSKASCFARPHINVLTKCDLLPPGVRTLRGRGTGLSLDFPSQGMVIPHK
jgi:hypothetical protein